MAENYLPEKLRAQIAHNVIKALGNVLRSYEKYTASIAVVKDDKFYESHKNARTALAHMDLLIRLGRSLGLRDPVIEQAENIQMQKAQKEWDDYCNRNVTEL